MKEFLACVCFFFGALAISIIIVNLADSKRCHEIGNILNYKVQYNYWTGCVVEKPNGEKVLLRQIRNLNEEK